MDDPYEPRGWWQRLTYWPRVTGQMLGDLLSSINQAFERGFQRATRSLSSVTELADRGDSVMNRFARVLAAPFVGIGVAVGWVVARLQATGTGRWILRLLRGLFYPLLAVLSFLSAFLQTRRRQLLWWSLPIVLVLAPILWLILSVSGQNNEQIRARYRQALAAAIESKQFEQADLFQQKLNQLGDRAERLELERADALVASGQTAEAYAIVTQLASLERPGNVAVHFWLAKFLAEGKSRETPERAYDQALQHLEFARRGPKENLPSIAYLQALVLLRQQRPEQALEALRPVQSQSLATSALVFQISGVMKLPTIREDARTFLNQIAKTPDSVANADENLFALWFTATQLAGKKSDLNSIVQRWVDRFPSNAQAQALAAEFELSSLDELLNSPEPWDQPRIVQLLRDSAQRLTVDNREVVSLRLNGLLKKAQQGSAAASEILRQLETATDTPSLILEFLGTDAVVAGNNTSARSLLLRAGEQNPQNYVAWNNLAYLLQTAFPNELELALNYANRATEIAPFDANIRETRGMIHLALRQYQPAVDDLEIALNGLAEKKKIHQALAQAYRELGNTTLAKAHARQADLAVQ